MNNENYFQKEYVVILPSTAVLLKSKGFNEQVMGYYTIYQIDQIDPEYPEGGGTFSMSKGEIEYSGSFMVNGEPKFGDYSNDSYICYSAPKQSEVQKWFRESKNNDILVYKELKGSSLGHCYKCRYENNGVIITTTFERDTYEEALEDGLIKSTQLL